MFSNIGVVCTSCSLFELNGLRLWEMDEDVLVLSFVFHCESKNAKQKR